MNASTSVLRHIQVGKRWKARRRLALPALRPVADVAVDAGGVGPVGLDRDDREAVPLDQPPRDRRAGAVEFGRAVAGLAEQDDPRVGEAVEGLGEGGIVDVRQRLGGRGDKIGQVAICSALALFRTSHGPRSAARTAPAPRSSLLEILLAACG